MHNLIQETIEKYIHQENAIFVFPTQTAADLWADRATSFTDTSAVAMERFLAWDDFKGKSIRTQQKDKTSIPSTMRKIFAEMVIVQNAEEPFLKNLIPEEYSKKASGFSSWIATILPSLKIWKNYYDREDSASHDMEDQDLNELYSRYKYFLDQYNFFDPAWEEPPFAADGNRYFIFFPEILSDYIEYKEILTKSPDSITVLNLPEQDQAEKDELPSVRFYANSRAEIRNTALFIRQLREEKKIDWDQIAVSVPDMDSYGAYIERELEIYHIPFVSRNARPLSSSEPGAIFKMISECVGDSYSFNTLKALLLNRSLPWRNTNLIDQLIEFGIQNNCICAYDEIHDNTERHHDVWEESFNNPVERFNTEQIPSFYRKLKSSLNAIVKAKSFEEVRDQYFKFRNEFLDMDRCSPQADRILSRCVTELGGLIDLEKDYPDCKIPAPFSFFTKTLDDVNYLEQTDRRGVQVIPYKLSAAAPFDCQIILDASQSSTSIVYKQLSFLREDKRAKLNLQETNVSQNFVRLYAMNSMKEKAFFACGERTFSGYSQPSSYLETKECRPSAKGFIPEVFGSDPYAEEKRYLFPETEGQTESSLGKKPARLFETSISGFTKWAERESYDCHDDSIAEAEVGRKLGETMKLEEGYTFSKTQMDKFFSCPRTWLFKNALYLKEEDNEAELIDKYATGNLYHSILHFFFSTLKDKDLELKATCDGISDEFEGFLNNAIDLAIEESNNSHLAKQLLITERPFIYSKMYKSVFNLCKIFFGCKIEGLEVKCIASRDSDDSSCNDKMMGYYDCLLRDQKVDEYFLLDYKTTTAPSNLVLDPESPDTQIDFQMPMYIKILESNHTEWDIEAEGIKIENAGFYTIKDDKCVLVFGDSLLDRINEHKTKKSKTCITREEFEPTVKQFGEFTRYFAERIHSLDFSTDPSQQDFTTCNSCEHKAICRRTFNVGRKM